MTPTSPASSTVRDATLDRPAATRTMAERLFPLEPTPDLDLSRATFAAPLRPDAGLSVLDISEFFGATSGGIRTYLLEKAAYVAAHPALRQVIVVPGEEDAITEADGVRAYRLRGPAIPRQKPYRFMLATRSTRRIVEHEAPDIIEVGSPGLVPWLMRFATRRLDTPLVHFYHSNFPRLFAPFPEHASRARRALYHGAWRYARRLDRMFDVTIAASEFSVGELQAAGIDRVVRVPLGVDLAHFRPARAGARAAVRRRAGLPEGPLAIFVGRFAKEKDLDVLVRAWGAVERTTDCTLALIGDGPVRPHLEALAAGRRRVRFVPFQSSREALADLVAAADLFVAPSSQETFGLSSLEALASGVPVLSADRGGVSEQVRRSGAGALFAAGDPAALAEGVRGLLREDLPALGARGRAYAEAEHAWDHVFARIFAVYRDVLAAR